MVNGCFKYEPGLGACPCACDKGESATEGGGFDWFKIAVLIGIAALIAKRTSKF